MCNNAAESSKIRKFEHSRKLETVFGVNFSGFYV